MYGFGVRSRALSRAGFAFIDFAQQQKNDTMKQGSNQRRGRGRGNGGRRPNRNQSYDSNGPDVKVRGTAQQVLDKYLTLARDAQSGGDRVKAEAYLQFAEHYYRIVNADQGQSDNERRSEQGEAAASGEGEQPETTETKAEKKSAPRGRRRAQPKNEATLAAEAAAENEGKKGKGDGANDDAPAAQPEEAAAGA